MKFFLIIMLGLSALSSSFANTQTNTFTYLGLWSCDMHQAGSHKDIPFKISFPKDLYSKIVKLELGDELSTSTIFTYGEGGFSVSILEKKALVKVTEKGAVSVEGKNIGKIEFKTNASSTKKFKANMTFLTANGGSVSVEASCQTNPFASQISVLTAKGFTLVLDL